MKMLIIMGFESVFSPGGLIDDDEFLNNLAVVFDEKREE